MREKQSILINVGELILINCLGFVLIRQSRLGGNILYYAVAGGGCRDRALSKSKVALTPMIRQNELPERPTGSRLKLCCWKIFNNNNNLIQPMTVIYPDMLFTVMLALDHVYPETT